MSLDRRSAMVQGALLTLACLLPGLAWAGEPAAPEPAPAPAAEASADPTDEPVFQFEPNDRRDPFTFTKTVQTVASIPTPGDSTTESTGRRGDTLKKDEIEAKRKEADTFYYEAEQILMEGDALQALARSDKGLEVFKEIPNLGAYAELQEVRERLFRIRKASERVRQRQDAEREFTRLNLRVTGVVARDKRSQAIVNQNIVNKGDMVATVGDSNDVVVVDEILPEQVIFLFRGYRMSLTLSDYIK
jgi:hypothetical protein